MVQVDVFWSFGIGAGMAAAAARQIKPQDDPFESKYFVKTMVYLSCFFVPSGAILLWGFPEWETMQVGRYLTIPAWLVGLFTLTNVTQGILGYWLAWRFIRRDNPRAAWMLCGIGYFLMFFILVHGWDGMGYQRFFYSCSWWGGNRECIPWQPGQFDAVRWATRSPVAWTLYAMGVVMIPLLLHWMSAWIKQGEDQAGLSPRPQRTILFCLLRLVFLHVLGSAIIASLLIHALGWALGLAVFLPLGYFGMIRRGGLTDGELRKILNER